MKFVFLTKRWENMMSLLKFSVPKTKSIASASIPLGRHKKHNVSPSLPPHPAVYCFYDIFWLNNTTESVGFLSCFEVFKHSSVKNFFTNPCSLKARNTKNLTSCVFFCSTSPVPSSSLSYLPTQTF